MMTLAAGIDRSLVLKSSPRNDFLRVFQTAPSFPTGLQVGSSSSSSNSLYPSDSPGTPGVSLLGPPCTQSYTTVIIRHHHSFISSPAPHSHSQFTIAISPRKLGSACSAGAADSCAHHNPPPPPPPRHHRPNHGELRFVGQRHLGAPPFRPLSCVIFRRRCPSASGLLARTLALGCGSSPTEGLRYPYPIE